MGKDSNKAKNLTFQKIMRKFNKDEMGGQTNRVRYRCGRDAIVDARTGKQE